MSLLMSGLCYFCHLCNVDSGGTSDGLWLLSTTLYSSLLLLLNVQLVVDIHYWTWLMHLGIWVFSFLLYCPFALMLYSYVYSPGRLYLRIPDYLSNLRHWLTVFVVAMALSLPIASYKLYNRLFRPNNIHIL
mmetsp:Transcript_5767/g.3304  ORF Transcript_5767/g.3304 Transcript_5767/m.3304 type:complete len:132 (+) Transcript_5767:206-601(+)